MKGIFHGDNLPTPPLGMGEFAGNFNCPLDGLRTAVAQKYPVQATYIRKEFAQRNLWRTYKKIGNMDQFRSLVLNRFYDFRMAVAHAVHGNSCQHVYMLLSVRIP